MSSTTVSLDSAKIPIMPDDEKLRRGQAIEAERVELGIPKARLARMAKMSTETYYRVVDGTAGDTSYTKVEEALRDHAEAPDDAESQPAALVRTEGGDFLEVEIVGDFGVRITARAPINHPSELERFAARLVRDIRSGSRGERGDES